MKQINLIPLDLYILIEQSYSYRTFKTAIVSNDLLTSKVAKVLLMVDILPSAPFLPSCLSVLASHT